MLNHILAYINCCEKETFFLLILKKLHMFLCMEAGSWLQLVLNLLLSFSLLKLDSYTDRVLTMLNWSMYRVRKVTFHNEFIRVRVHYVCLKIAHMCIKLEVVKYDKSLTFLTLLSFSIIQQKLFVFDKNPSLFCLVIKGSVELGLVHSVPNPTQFLDPLTTKQ